MDDSIHEFPPNALLKPRAFLGLGHDFEIAGRKRPDGRQIQPRRAFGQFGRRHSQDHAGRPAEAIDLRLTRFTARVLLDLIEAVDREIQLVAPGVVDDEEVDGEPADLAMDQPLVAADPVFDVDDVVADVEAAEVLDERTGSVPLALPVPRAMRSMVLRLIVFYLLAVSVMLTMTPWRELAEGGAGITGSPFVRAFGAAGIPFAAGVSSATREGEAVEALLKFMTSPAAAAVLKAKGLKPPH